MTSQDLINSPYYDALMSLARANGIDEDLMQECALGVIARLQVLLENDIQPTQQHVSLCMENWFKERQKLAERYQSDLEFRAEFHERVYNQLQEESQWLQKN